LKLDRDVVLVDSRLFFEDAFLAPAFFATPYRQR
jgi:hypothetical protein